MALHITAIKRDVSSDEWGNWLALKHFPKTHQPTALAFEVSVPSTTMKMAKLSHVNLLWLADELDISSKQAFFTELFELIQPHSAYQGIDLQEYLRVYQTTTTPADQTDPTLQTR